MVSSEYSREIGCSDLIFFGDGVFVNFVVFWEFDVRNFNDVVRF